MAVKEMLIVFVYDLEFCKNEHDDPLKAIKYFHPSWVSDQQKLALCGQLMGLMNFCSDFELVDCISLQNGKFKIERFGRFILAIGTDRNVKESLLEHRSELMTKILRLYHNDINKIYEQFDDPKNFSDKLYHIFETYLPILQYNSNLLQNVYKLYLPKSASNLFLDATQILENVTSRPNVLGGMILYNNKVVATQFSIDLTKTIVATDPMRLKTTAEIAKNVNFHIPSGSQIIKIFITLCEYNRLQKHIKKVNDSTSLGIQSTLPLPFSIKKKSSSNKESSMMKRDKSLIFTHIPEEEALIDIPSPIEKSRNRPNHLPLKLKTVAPESGIASIVSFDENDSYPDFIGKTSVCCTPMTENKILAGPIQSIFAMGADNNVNEVKVTEQQKDKKIEKTREWENVYIPYANNPFKSLQWKKKSCDDLFSSFSNEIDEDTTSEYKVYNTITDPFYPIFNKKNKPMSKKLFDDFQSLFNPCNDDVLKSSQPLNEQKSTKMNNELKKRLEADPMIMKRSENKNSPSRILRNQKKKMLKLPIKSFSLDLDTGKMSTNVTASNCVATTSSSSNNNASIFDSPSTKTKKYMGGLQLTPLMSKLTLLAMNENENFSNLDMATPNYYDTPVDNTNRSLFNRLSKVDEEKHETVNDESNFNENMNGMKRVDLLICGQQNMTLMVIVDENLCDQQIVQQMFEICVNRLSRLEQKLNDVINVTVDLKASEYSFMTFDTNWNVMKRSGAYDLQTTMLMHDNFTSNKNVSDIIIRTNDSMIYGHNSGDQEIFYQHAAKQQSGFLIPSEFTIISQAKRKLERDQSVVLL
ncbi:hypothetical protein PVAND_007631 [Polypedilum vanderplanki]|uniref:CCZ1/INTU/HSP4 first Longin domain-containing protein n=1 Tax=Polypedilum vanderplanki TaxID=319348 RepID=A0A9J6C7Y2_POLVA|nr:hypothetical protein PVAND_007631 [Polypedilum vanderplanki]